MSASTASAPTTAQQSTLCVAAPGTWRAPWLSCYQISPWQGARPGDLRGDVPTAEASWQS